MKTTDAKPECPLLVAVMCAVPTTVDVMAEVAIPFTVEAGGIGLPMFAANVTGVPFVTVLLY